MFRAKRYAESRRWLNLRSLKLESTSRGLQFSGKLEGSSCNCIKQGIYRYVFSYEFCESYQDIFF